MAVGFHIKLGYMSGTTFAGSWNEAWNKVKAIVADVRDDPLLINEQIADSTFRKFLPHMHIDEFYEYSEIYKHGKNGTPISVSDNSILIMCSGGGDSRIAKELTARAFVRAVMEECHKQGIDISVIVG